MGIPLELPSLHVEGEDDCHSIIHLLIRHGVPFAQDKRCVDVRNQRNDEGVLESMDIAIRAGTNQAVGFVLDADVLIEDRWKQVCHRLRRFGLDLPKAPPPDGYIADVPEFRSRMGVWIMPDNVLDCGKLEDLLRTLVPKDDTLIAHAEESTDVAKAKGATFTDNDRIKAILHAWLAWQQQPGRPFGTAINAKFFEHDSAVALRFVAWFKQLFRL